PATSSVTVVMGMKGRQNREKIMNADGTWLKYPDSDAFDLQITRAELRAGCFIPFPGYEKGRYAAGFTGADGDLAFNAVPGSGLCFDANPPALWSEGRTPADASAYHWP